MFLFSKLLFNFVSECSSPVVICEIINDAIDLYISVCWTDAGLLKRKAVGIDAGVMFISPNGSGYLTLKSFA